MAQGIKHPPVMSYEIRNDRVKNNTEWVGSWKLDYNDIPSTGPKEMLVSSIPVEQDNH